MPVSLDRFHICLLRFSFVRLVCHVIFVLADDSRSTFLVISLKVVILCQLKLYQSIALKKLYKLAFCFSKIGRSVRAQFDLAPFYSVCSRGSLRSNASSDRVALKGLLIELLKSHRLVYMTIFHLVTVAMETVNTLATEPI